jgi:hypothetical protein
MHRRAINKNRSGSFRPGNASTGERPAGFIRLATILKNEAALCAAAIVLMSVLFVIRYQASLWLALCSVPFALLAGYTMFFFERQLEDLHRKVMGRGGRIQAGFLAFFLFLLLGILVFLALVSYPMGMVADRLGSGHLHVHYGRWAINLGIIVALLCWLRCVVRRLSGLSSS